jgi:predicted TIM-barrel fold metal-dependent hydrolase
MAEWQYAIQRLELQSGDDFDQQLEETLKQYGAKGWELVEVLQYQDSPNLYRLIFKAAKPLD